MAEVKSETPVGTLAELKDSRLDPASYGSCSEPETARNGTRKSIGCPHFEACHFVKGGAVPKRWQGVKGSGPELVPVRVVLDNGGIAERQLPCYSYMQLSAEYNDLPDGGGSVEVIDSDEYLYRGTRPNTVVENGKSITTHIDDVKTKKVDKFPRISTNPQFIGDSYAIQARQRVAAERKEKAKAKRLALPDEPEAEDSE